MAEVEVFWVKDKAKDIVKNEETGAVHIHGEWQKKTFVNRDAAFEWIKTHSDHVCGVNRFKSVDISSLPEKELLKQISWKFNKNIKEDK